jgi:ketopantoate reductase
LTRRAIAQSADAKGVRYQLVNVGWKNSSTRIYGCVLHVDIKNGKIWVQHDGTEDAIAQSADAKGVSQISLWREEFRSRTLC